MSDIGKPVAYQIELPPEDYGGVMVKRFESEHGTIIREDLDSGTVVVRRTRFCGRGTVRLLRRKVRIVESLPPWSNQAKPTE